MVLKPADLLCVDKRNSQRNYRKQKGYFICKTLPPCLQISPSLISSGHSRKHRDDKQHHHTGSGPIPDRSPPPSRNYETTESSEGTPCPTGPQGCPRSGKQEEERNTLKGKETAKETLPCETTVKMTNSITLQQIQYTCGALHIASIQSTVMWQFITEWPCDLTPWLRETSKWYKLVD